ncbi:MAG: DUF58 domain-containing protein [Deltaproteobacteria bacterium]|jgi:uncharacterized protein (DUF58 family)|nr:DUF58 domain-containing protein [Deltaproteobacteria bacterium]
MSDELLLSSFSPRFYKQLQQLKIHTRRVFLGSRQGGHNSLRKGHGLEFSDYKLYTPGDDFRNIDWGAFARSDRLYIKQFREEQDLNVMFLLDGSGSMQSEDHKFAFCSKLALALGYVALTDGDTVTFSVLGQENSPKFINPRLIAKAENFLNKITPCGEIDLPLELGLAVQKLKTPGKCFVISDFLCNLEQIIAGIKLLVGKNFEVVLLQVLTPAELNLELNLTTTKVLDVESNAVIELALDEKSKREYLKILVDHIEQIEKFAKKSGVPHVLISTAEDIESVLLQRLPSLGLLR